MMFNSQRDQVQPQQNSSSGMQYPISQNVSGKQIDVEFGKHILKVDELELTFYKTFAGWRKVIDEHDVQVFGIAKTFERERYITDYDSRLMNEQGANHILQALQPLIMPAVATSKLNAITIYNNWKGRLISLRMSLLDSCFFPKMRCKSCKFNTSKFSSMHYHLRNTGHDGYRKIINPYELDSERLPEIMATVANLHTITYKAETGFTLKEIAENYVNQNNPMQMLQNSMQPRGIIDTLFGNRRNF